MIVIDRNVNTVVILSRVRDIDANSDFIHTYIELIYVSCTIQ